MIRVAPICSRENAMRTNCTIAPRATVEPGCTRAASAHTSGTSTSDAASSLDQVVEGNSGVAISVPSASATRQAVPAPGHELPMLARRLKAEFACGQVLSERQKDPTTN